MTVTPTYPGVYIEELPSTSHTITPAPTSVAAFVGYTHPLKTKHAGTTPSPAIELFSFSDYQNNFGGFFNSPWLPDYVGRAVFQFFLNGGSTAYVVGLTDLSYVAATAQIKSSPPITLTAREPVGIGSGASAVGIPMQVTISNLQTTEVTDDTADIVITYGSQVETYRKVVIGTLYDQSPTQPGRLAQSALVTVAAPSSPPTSYPLSGSPLGAGKTTIPFTYASPLPTSYSSISSPAGLQAIGAVFTDNFPLDKVPIFNLLVIPGITDPNVLAEGVAYAERKRAFYIMDSPPNWDVDTQATDAPPPSSPPSSLESPLDGLQFLPVPVSTNAAIYFPWLKTTDPVTNNPSTSPPSGFVAGIYAHEDVARGVWKSPAGLETALNGTLGVVPTGMMTDAQQGVLNGSGINCLRVFPSLPPVVYGARTLAYRDVALKDQWGYIAVRRMALFIEQSLYANLTWAVFEPNDTPLWNALTQEVSAFMLGLFRQGAFAGTTPSQAFLVLCDATTTTPSDINNGIVNILVGFAPLKPAEFVIVKIAQLAGQGAS
jgi:phage tail sheath protein FI